MGFPDVMWCRVWKSKFICEESPKNLLFLLFVSHNLVSSEILAWLAVNTLQLFIYFSIISASSYRTICEMSLQKFTACLGALQFGKRVPENMLLDTGYLKLISKIPNGKLKYHFIIYRKLPGNIKYQSSTFEQYKIHCNWVLYLRLYAVLFQIPFWYWYH